MKEGDYPILYGDNYVLLTLDEWERILDLLKRHLNKEKEESGREQEKRLIIPAQV